MTGHLGLLLMLLHLPFCFSIFLASPPLEANCHPKILNSTTRYKFPSTYSKSLELFVCPGVGWHPKYLFVDVHLDINLTDPNDYDLYQGANCSSVEDAYRADRRLFGLLSSSSLWRSLQVYPFNSTVIGVATSLPYQLALQVHQFSLWRMALFFGGVLLFLLSPSLTRNTLFFYTGGCSLGVFTSGLLVVFLIYRCIPKKTIAVPILIGGSSAASWMFFHAWSNLSDLLLHYQHYVIGYVTTVVVISLAYCYKRGPPTDERSLNLLQWTFQAIGCALIYCSSHLVELTLAAIAVLVLHSLLGGLAKDIFCAFLSLWDYFFPKPRRLLTEDEFQREGAEYTKQELDRLRDFCRSSPASDAWLLTNKLKQPRRMASFVQGGGHVDVREVANYDRMMPDDEEYSDDDRRSFRTGRTVSVRSLPSQRSFAAQSPHFFDPDENDDYQEDDAYAFHSLRSQPRARQSNISYITTQSHLSNRSMQHSPSRRHQSDRDHYDREAYSAPRRLRNLSSSSSSLRSGKGRGGGQEPDEEDFVEATPTKRRGGRPVPAPAPPPPNSQRDGAGVDADTMREYMTSDDDEQETVY